jgi:hypothetical protein
MKVAGSSVPRFDRTLCNVDVAINHLKIWQSPIVEQLRPSFIAMVAPDSKQGDAMIYLGVPPQPSACLETTSPLKTTQKRCLVIRCIPELPGNNASTMPDRILVWPHAPQILVPAEAINRLTADAAKTRTQVVDSLAVRSRRRSEGCCPTRFAIVTDAPGPADRSSSLSCEGAGQAIGANWMRSPVGFDCESRRRRDERPIERACEHSRRKDGWQSLGKPRERLAIPFHLLGLPIRHAAAPPLPHSAGGGVKPSFTLHLV